MTSRSEVDESLTGTTISDFQPVAVINVFCSIRAFVCEIGSHSPEGLILLPGFGRLVLERDHHCWKSPVKADWVVLRSGISCTRLLLSGPDEKAVT
jgi:hypothetical protein